MAIPRDGSVHKREAKRAFNSMLTKLVQRHARIRRLANKVEEAEGSLMTCWAELRQAYSQAKAEKVEFPHSVVVKVGNQAFVVTNIDALDNDPLVKQGEHGLTLGIELAEYLVRDIGEEDEEFGF